MTTAAKLVTPPTRPDGFDRGYCVKPTVFAGVDNTKRIAREEVFGPVLVVNGFDTEDEVVEIANDTDYGVAVGTVRNRALSSAELSAADVGPSHSVYGGGASPDIGTGSALINARP